MFNYRTFNIAVLLIVFSVTSFAMGTLNSNNEREGFKILKDFNEIYQYLDKDNIKIKVAPGTYSFPENMPDKEPLIAFNGSNTHYDFTGVKLLVTRKCGTIIGLNGNGIVFEGLNLKTSEGKNKYKGKYGKLGINIIGDDVKILNVSIELQGSYPYGYGSYFGIGKNSSVKLYKACAIRIGPADNTKIINCNVIMRAFGHGIFIRGANNALIEGTKVEGLLRQTDDILVEKSGTAFEQGFIDASGDIIRPGKITSLSEDGIRIYPDSGTSRNYNSKDKRETGNITVKNCTVNKMRRGICTALGGRGHVIIDSKVTECARVGYNIGSETTIKNCRGDAKYSQVLDIARSNSVNSKVELTVLDSRQRQANSFDNDPGLLANINGLNHNIILKSESVNAVPKEMTIEIGGDVGWASGQSVKRGSSINLVNSTPAWVLLHPDAENCMVKSFGRVVDYGKVDDNKILDFN